MASQVFSMPELLEGINSIAYQHAVFTEATPITP